MSAGSRTVSPRTTGAGTGPDIAAAASSRSGSGSGSGDSGGRAPRTVPSPTGASGAASDTGPVVGSMMASSVPSGSFTFAYPSESARRASGGTPRESMGRAQVEKEKEKDGEGEVDEAKRRKIQRACDACRKKKIRCDGPMNALSTSKCRLCQENGIDCTYVEAAKRRGPPKGYMEALEQRCSRLERMMQQLHPSLDLSEYIGPQIDREEFDNTAHTEALRAAGIPAFPRMKPIAVSTPLHMVASNVSTDSVSSPLSHRASVASLTGASHANANVAPGASSGVGTGSLPNPNTTALMTGSVFASEMPTPNTQVLGPSPWKLYEQDPNRPSAGEEHEADARMHKELAAAMNRLNMRDDAWRYHGKASLAHLLHTFRELKHQDEEDGGAEDDVGDEQGKAPERGAAGGGHNHASPAVDSPASATSGSSKWSASRAGAEWVQFFETMNQVKRSEFWAVPEYEVVIANENVKPVDFTYWPDSGLDHALIDAYFDKVNVDMPLLNRLIFVRQYTSGLHRSNHDFAKVCLMVFANGARFTHDERIYWPRDWATTEEGKKRLEEDADGTLKYSAGWKYMRAVLQMGRSVVQGPNLFDFQAQVLVCMFLQGAAVPHLTLLISGIGLRGVQELGIHVRSTLMRANPVERALYSRAFWCLYHIDRLNCAAVGRSVALQDTDFDADYPIAVDDEYWETGDPATDFVQPPHAGVAKVAAFVHLLKLDHVIGAALRTLYAINHLPGEEHEQHMIKQKAIVMELDSALNSWADSVPDALRWDPTRTDQRLFEQSAVLYSQYYYCQILIHRPFIPTPRRPVTIGLPSLVICSNASRSIANIVDAVLRRGRQYGILAGQVVGIHFLVPCWSAAVILLVSIYAGRQQKAERERAMQDVRRCIAALKELEMTWRQAGKMTDMLCQLASEPIKKPLVEYGSKRRQPEQEMAAAEGQTSPAGGVSARVKRSMAGPTSLSRMMASSVVDPDWLKSQRQQAKPGEAVLSGSPAKHRQVDSTSSPVGDTAKASTSTASVAGAASAPPSRVRTPPNVWGLSGWQNGDDGRVKMSVDDSTLPLASDMSTSWQGFQGQDSQTDATSLLPMDLDTQARAMALQAQAQANSRASILACHKHVESIRKQADTVPFHSPSTFGTDLLTPNALDPTVRAVQLPESVSPVPLTRNMSPFQLGERVTSATASNAGAVDQSTLNTVASSAPAQTASEFMPWSDPTLFNQQADTSWIDTFAQPVSAYQNNATTGSGAELAVPFDMENLWDATLYNPMNGGYDFGDVGMGMGGDAAGGMAGFGGMGGMNGMNGNGTMPDVSGMGGMSGLGHGSGMGMPGFGMSDTGQNMWMGSTGIQGGQNPVGLNNMWGAMPSGGMPARDAGQSGQYTSQQQAAPQGQTGDAEGEDVWKRYFQNGRS